MRIKSLFDGDFAAEKLERRLSLTSLSLVSAEVSSVSLDDPLPEPEPPPPPTDPPIPYPPLPPSGPVGPG